MPEDTRKYGLLGWPVKHSVSPPMQGAGFAALGIRATYELIPVRPQDLGETVRRLVAEGFAGWNVTVPHKEHIIQFLDEVDPAAAQGGSVNTVVNRGGRLHGFSTDGYGLEEALRESFGFGVAGKRVVFLGAGGAARATSVYFALRGARNVLVANRTVTKAERLADTIRAAARSCAVDCLSLADTARVRSALAQTDVLIQATSLGLHSGDPLPLPPDCLPSSLCVMDMIYRKTPFLEGAAARGCPTADGRGMLLHQGVKSLSIWTGEPAPPLEPMRAALHAALR